VDCTSFTSNMCVNCDCVVRTISDRTVEIIVILCL
jgi:hypothetical protein